MVQRRRLAAGAGPLRAAAGAVTQYPVGLGPDLVQGYAKALQDTGGHTFALTQQADEQMLGADIGMVHTAGFVDGQLHDLLGPGSQTDLPLGGFFAAADDELHRGAYLSKVYGETG